MCVVGFSSAIEFRQLRGIYRGWRRPDVSGRRVAGLRTLWASSRGRRRAHEFLIWPGEAQSQAEALRKAAQADPRVGLRYMRIRHEDSLE